MDPMPTSHPDVLVVVSRPAGEGRRSFAVESPGSGPSPELPPEIVHEGDLVKAMRAAGYRLTMVGGGSLPDEVRRFYFRRPRATGG